MPPAYLTQGGQDLTTAPLKAAPLAYTGSGINPKLWVGIGAILLLLGICIVTYPGRRRQGGHR